MGIRNTTEVSCDFKGCKLGQGGGPVVLSWCNEDVSSGKAPPPPGSETFVTLTLNGAHLAFCSRLHASEFFLPDMYEIKQKGLVEFPKDKWTGPEISPENGQEE